MQQRYYDPIAGRFLSVDPVTTDEKSGGHFNRYVYANNSPYKYVDPDGRAGVLAVEVVVVGGIILAGHQVLPGREAREQSLGSLIRSVGNGESNGGSGQSQTGGGTRADAENRITGGAKPDRVSGSNKQYDAPPTGETADEVMKDIKVLPGAKVNETSGTLGQVTVVTLPDGSRVVDRNSSTGPRTIQTQNANGKSRTETRFPKDELRKKDGS